LSRIKLYELAHARSGDKGEVTNISLIPYKEDDYDLLAIKVTAEKVKEHFAEITTGEVIRYDMAKLKVFNFVLKGTRPGGVGAALDLDPHGKSLSWALLEMEIEL
jgi:hypothetical protein